ncbi:MAG: alpha-galactosidase [Roseburia sp.]|nr:alpha-galactosidase [Roseburia sp.]
MIIVKDKSFLLQGKNYGYAMYVNGAGYLQHLYYGKKLSTQDMPYLTAILGKTAEPDPDDFNVDMSVGSMPSETGGFGKGDFRSATVIARRADGAAMSSFKYVSHKITDGAPKLYGMPCIRKADKTLTVTLKDEYSDTVIDLNYSVSDSSDVLVRNTVIRNTGDKPLDLTRAYSFCVDLPNICQTYSALRLAGDWGSEREPITTPVADGTLRVESSRGYSSHSMNPFMAILVGDCNEIKGECYGFNLLYSGNFALTAEASYNKSLRIQGGINEYTFGWNLAVGESFETPQVALCYSAEGVGGMSRAYHDFFRDYIINPAYARKRRPIVINNWEATYFGFDNEKLFAIIDDAAKLGADTFVLDDGWFGKRDNDKSGLGDWFVNENKLKGGLKTVIDRCKKKGLKFGLWFEPEMVCEDSDLYRLHPEYAVVKRGVTPSRSRNQLILDLTKKEVVDYVFNAVSKVLKENDISYVKWDKNRDMTEFYSDSLPAERQGEFAHRYVLGFYELAERLTSAFPEVFFEGCASGGGRFDGGALYYFPQIWTSDDTDAYERAKIQWGTSICYPLSTMSCHVSACPNHQTGRTTPFETRGAIASLGATGYELDLTKLTAEEKSQIKTQIENYGQIDGLILNGDLYRLANPFSDNYFCEIVVSKDKSRAYVVGERFHIKPDWYNRIIKLDGLDEGKTYIIKELNLTASGGALMNAGLLLPRLPDYGAWTWHINEVK